MPVVSLQDGRNEPALVGGILDRYGLSHEHPRARLKGEHVHAVSGLRHTRPCQREHQRRVSLPPRRHKCRLLRSKYGTTVGGSGRGPIYMDIYMVIYTYMYTYFVYAYIYIGMRVRFGLAFDYGCKAAKSVCVFFCLTSRHRLNRKSVVIGVRESESQHTYARAARYVA